MISDCLHRNTPSGRSGNHSASGCPKFNRLLPIGNNAIWSTTSPVYGVFKMTATYVPVRYLAYRLGLTDDGRCLGCVTDRDRPSVKYGSAIRK